MADPIWVYTLNEGFGIGGERYTCLWENGNIHGGKFREITIISLENYLFLTPRHEIYSIPPEIKFSHLSSQPIHSMVGLFVLRHTKREFAINSLVKSII